MKPRLPTARILREFKRGDTIGGIAVGLNESSDWRHPMDFHERCAAVESIIRRALLRAEKKGKGKR